MSHKTETLTQQSSNEMQLISLLHSKPFVAFEILIGVLWEKKFPLNFYDYRARGKKKSYNQQSLWRISTAVVLLPNEPKSAEAYACYISVSEAEVSLPNVWMVGKDCSSESS